MQLMDTTVIKDWDAARKVLEQYPTLLTTGDENAPFPLCLTAALGQLDTVKFLIANGARVDGAGKFGMTPLHWAAVHNEPAVARILLDAGADQSLKSWFFLTSANLAHANSSIATFRTLVPRGVNTEDSRVRVTEMLKALGCSLKM
jgi:ankyrin repeat protein